MKKTLLLSTGTVDTYTWTFEGTEGVTYEYKDGTDSNSMNPSIRYLIAGTYDVSLIAENESGSDDETKINYITVQSGGLLRALGIIR